VTLPALIQYDHGIAAVDSGYYRPNLDAIHVIVERGRAAIVDTGTSHSVPGLLAALEALDVDRDAVDYILVTHIHLDHAGGAGQLARALPRTPIVVHPRGARHLVDPGKLVASTQAVYGEEEFRRLYGEVLPVPAERLIEAPDGFRLSLAGRELVFLDTPGHARHHYCIYDARSRSVFTGDTFGISYREFDGEGTEFIFPTSTPAQFDPDAAHVSIDRLASLEPRHAFITHYSRVSHVARHAATLHRLLEEYRRLAEQARSAGPARHRVLTEGLRELLLEEAQASGSPLPEETAAQLLAMDIELNAQGIEVWMDAKAKA
jgi:glyoxylase-like metal-dependent hydrolase (beta-lactamase superfamily II)